MVLFVRLVAQHPWALPVIAWLSAMAFGCEPLGQRLTEAQAALDDAEVALARAAVDGAYKSLECQQQVVEPEELLALYRLDGVVALAAGDKGRAVYAVLRAGAIDPVSAIHPQEHGPDLAFLFATYAAPLGASLIAVSVDDSRSVWIDGHPIGLVPLGIARGEHVVQVGTPGALASRVVEISADTIFHEGEPGPAPLLGPPVERAAPPSPPMPLLPEPVAALIPVEHPHDVPSRVVWIGGLAVGAASGAAFVLGWTAERDFNADPYQAETYAGCQRDEPCWSTGRTEEIRAASDRVRLFYLAGYGLAGAGAGLFLSGATGAAIHTRW